MGPRSARPQYQDEETFPPRAEPRKGNSATTEAKVSQATNRSPRKGTPMTTPETKPSALSALKALSQKKPVATSVALSTQVNDPAIAGASMTKGSKNVVTLGFDPAFAEKALQCASLKEALEKAETEFKVLQSETRDYGAGKRGLYNDTFKANVTTVKFPYEVDVPGGGKEKQYISVICSNKYSVQQDIVLGNKEALGEMFPRLFTETVTKSLKPNAEELIRGILAEVGLKPDEIETSMENLFDTTTKVATTEGYEQESKKVPDALKTVLDQAVTRAAPGLKFG